MTDALTATRVIFVSLVIAVFLYAYVLMFIVDRQRWFAAVRGPLVSVVVLAGAGCLGVAWSRQKPLDTRDVRALTGSYRAALFIGIGLSEIPALLGFVMTFVTETLWIYLAGMGFSLVGMALIAPTRRNIEMRQEQISDLGSPLSLGAALTAPRRPDP